MSEVLKKHESGPWEWYSFMCPGCKRSHPFHTKNPDGVVWMFNGNMEKPTFGPSLMCDRDNPERRCHLVLTDGMIHFCDDCHHELKGKVVPMEPFQE